MKITYLSQTGNNQVAEDNTTSKQTKRVFKFNVDEKANVVVPENADDLSKEEEVRFYKKALKSRFA